jgi:hypothetical protein
LKNDKNMIRQNKIFDKNKHDHVAYLGSSS